MAHPNGHPYDSSLLRTEILPPQEPGGLPDTHKVVKLMNKEDNRLHYNNRVNAGVVILSPELLKETKKFFVPRYPDTPDKIDFESLWFLYQSHLDREVLYKTRSSLQAKRPEVERTTRLSKHGTRRRIRIFIR